MYTAGGLSTFRTMTRFVPILIASLLALAAVGGAVFSASSDRSEHRSGPATGGVAAREGPDRPSATAPERPPAPTAASNRRLDEAIRELDLIRPSRQKVAEDFTLRTPTGDSFRLGEQRGKAVLVNFWATWCAPCREEMPAMERLYQRHRDHGLVLVAISLDADPAVVPPYVKESKLTFPIALDPRAEVANKYGVRALPSSFVVDREGFMAALALGPRTWDNQASHALVEALTVSSRSTSVDGPERPRPTTR